MSISSWFKRNFGSPPRNRVNQRGNTAGGRVVAGDLCGGNYNLRGKAGSRVPEHTVIGGNLNLEVPDATVMDLVTVEVAGKVTINGHDVTNSYRVLRARQ